MGKENRKSVEFPKDFVWGAATSAYQIEGAVKEDVQLMKDSAFWYKYVIETNGADL